MWPSYVWTFVPCAPRPGHPPADLIRQREMKWVEMTSHWEKTMSRRYKKVRGEWPHTGPLGLPPLYLAKFSLLCPSTSWLHSLLLAETLARWQIVPEAS